MSFYIDLTYRTATTLQKYNIENESKCVVNSISFHPQNYPRNPKIKPPYYLHPQYFHILYSDSDEKKNCTEAKRNNEKKKQNKKQNITLKNL